MPERHEIATPDGRTLVVHDAGGDGAAVVWHHGSPQTGALIEPVLAAAAPRGLRMVGYARPGYAGSTLAPGREVAAAAADVVALADHLGIGRFAVAGASGGGPHALACAALLPERVTAAIAIACPAPPTRDFDWYAGMADPGGLRAAAEGREARARFAEVGSFDAGVFTAADWAILAADWAPLGTDAGRALGDEGMIDDDVAFAAPWGFDPAGIDVPVLLVQGGEDRMIPPAHAEWLRAHIPGAELWLRPEDGHVSILTALPAALDWLPGQAVG